MANRSDANVMVVELDAETAEVVRAAERSGREVVATRDGKLLARLVPLDEAATSPEHPTARALAAVERGKRRRERLAAEGRAIPQRELKNLKDQVHGYDPDAGA